MPIGCFPCCSKSSSQPKPDAKKKPKEKPKDKPRRPKDLNKFISECIKAHNQLRKKHKSPPLKQNKKLSAHAQKYAEHLAATNTFQHSKNTFKKKNVGENLASKAGSRPVDYTGSEVTDSWYSEIRQYNFNREAGTQSAGHFTQVVWKGSKEVGIGKAFSASGKVIVVANYLPAGNVITKFKDNINRPK